MDAIQHNIPPLNSQAECMDVCHTIQHVCMPRYNIHVCMPYDTAYIMASPRYTRRQLSKSAEQIRKEQAAAMAALQKKIEAARVRASASACARTCVCVCVCVHL